MSAPEPSLFDHIDEAADARADADLKAGRVISHAAMEAWLLSWGTPEELTPPHIGD